MLLGLDHYNCRCVIRRRCQCKLRTSLWSNKSNPSNFQAYFERTKPVIFIMEPKRRHTEAAVQSWLMPRDPRLRAIFKRVARVTLVITRMQFLAMKKARSEQRVTGHPLLPSRCGRFCAYERPNGPLVVRAFLALIEFPLIDRNNVDLSFSMCLQRAHVGRQQEKRQRDDYGTCPPLTSRK